MEPALELTGVGKTFGKVRALDAVDLTVRAGEVHCVLGENGAGKSTLCNLIFGSAVLDEGDMRLFGETYRPRRPAEALGLGVAMVHQHFSLVPTLTVAENLLLAERTRLRMPDLTGRVAAIEAEYGLKVDLAAQVADLPVGERQSVEIVKCLLRDPRLVLLDEPTAVLGPAEVEALLATCRRIADTGRAVVLVTHKLGEIERAGDAATVLRGGRVAGSGPLADFTKDELVELMVGRHLADLDPLLVAGLDAEAAGEGHEVHEFADTAEDGPAPVVSVRGLRVRGAHGADVLDGVDLDLRPGEIVGIAGVEGNGQSELVAVLSGALAPDGGAFSLDGTDLTKAAPAARTAAGLGVIPEDRHHEGCLPGMTVAENLFLGRLAEFRRFGLLDRKAMRARATEVIAEHGIRASGPDAPMRTLSGGNQQKVVVARELALDPLRCLIAAQPTRGLDIGAVDAVLSRVRDAAASGAAVLVVSSELPELLTLCDRVMVAYRGRLLGPVTPGTPGARDAIGRLMLGAAA
ncbi:nucleoside ABC transporter ATP-binding protein [Actinocorallia herbida]|uniref:Nucleoside ABC transporter ATP-binding protein n=1 Tax=Actinocorallia herbida TaxID=58109 RepID=A0A3N1CTA4_9ACTN|nr:ABC transporter ATP-binding protein [Actinocorallia herbida]ROO84543.1 nucleoside ABC transporter ATP-binding protein [Actinocorallia herbida]